ncbi:hypothetical protein Tco_0826952 [Tanacetum coccineum]
MSDMTLCLNDLSYIPQNNKQNEPTQGDIGETSNEPTQVKRNEFEELYTSANEELYPGCDFVTRLDFMAKFTYFKVKGKLTDSIFNEMLEFFQNVFSTSKGYMLPPAKITKICSVCNTSRWKDSNIPGKKVPKKLLHYFPIIPRLQHLYKSSHTAKEMTWHATGKCTELGLAADGFNPFGNLSQSYSMWPVILTTYNMWPALKGVETIDVATSQKFNMRAMVLWTINDFPAQSSLSGWSGQGYKACPTCNKDTPFMHGDPPRKFDQDQILAQLAILPTLQKGKHSSYGGVKIKRNVLVELN